LPSLELGWAGSARPPTVYPGKTFLAGLGWLNFNPEIIEINLEFGENNMSSTYFFFLIMSVSMDILSCKIEQKQETPGPCHLLLQHPALT
jgi:hypothetical protein